MVSFDVKSHFTSVPLEYTIHIIIKRIFEDHEITTIFTKSEMKKLLTLCTKNVHFSVNNDIYTQIDGVAMGSPLGPVVANIFMVELETTLVPKLEDLVQKWRSFVYDTYVYVKIGSVEYVLSVLNSFHKNIKFTYKEEQNNTLPFLDVLFIRDGEKLNTTVYRKDTHNDLYLHWNSFTPVSWKRGTLKSLISRAYMVCSNETLLEKELKHLKHVFHKINGYPWWVIDQVSTSFQENINKSKSSEYYHDTSEQPAEKMYSLILPYAGPKGNSIIKTMKNNLNRILPDNVKTRVTYSGQKLSTKLQIKDKTKDQHKHDLVYYSKCPEPTCNEDYLGETGRRIIERSADHCGKDKQSHLLRHALYNNHKTVDLKDFKIIDSSYHNNRFKRKISEALYIKEYKPSLNTQEQSVQLKAFN